MSAPGGMSDSLQALPSSWTSVVSTSTNSSFSWRGKAALARSSGKRSGKGDCPVWGDRAAGAVGMNNTRASNAIVDRITEYLRSGAKLGGIDAVWGADQTAFSFQRSVPAIEPAAGAEKDVRQVRAGPPTLATFPGPVKAGSLLASSVPDP